MVNLNSFYYKGNDLLCEKYSNNVLLQIEVD